MKWFETIDIVILIFTVLLAVSAVIVAMIVINMRKRRHRIEGEEQRRQAEQEAKPKEEHKRIEEEPQHKIQGEQQEQRPEEKEVQEKTQKEEIEPPQSSEQRIEEGQHQKSEEVDKEIKEVESQNAVDNRREKLPPGKRGGRSRDAIKQSAIDQPPKPKLRSPKPEIICWNEGRRWIVGIEVPEEFESPSVTQNEEALEQDTTNESCYRLRHTEGTVKVTWNGGIESINLIEVGRNYLIFKLRRNWKGLGRLVRCPTSGHYLAIAPQEWKRDEERSDSAPVVPENAQLGYKAHFFYLEQGSHIGIGFITASGESILVESASPRFQLVGKEIPDASDDAGPLFVEEPPLIEVKDEGGWNDVGIIVVGKEGRGRNRWRMQFVPQEGLRRQRMPDELTNQRGGWYFARIYDNNDNFLESMDFRFITGLKDICLEKSGCLPGPNGYNEVKIQFVHQNDCKVELKEKDKQHALEIRRNSGKTIVTIPTKLDYDKTRWILRDANAEIEVTLLVERIWWWVGKMGVVPTDWMDKPVSLSQKDFTAITDKALWVRFPRVRWVGKIDVGFDRAKSRPYNVEVEKKEIAIPLRDFCDAEEIENRQREFTFKIWVQPEGTRTYEVDEAVVVKIPAEMPPPVPTELSLPPKPNFSLQATVRCHHGQRKGKGFSRNEITKAGISKQAVKYLPIPYDKRRKSSHSWNIEILKSIIKRK